MANDVTEILGHTPKKRLCLRWFIVAMTAAVVFVPVCVVLINVAAFLLNPFGGNDTPAEIDPSNAFSQLTGWRLPSGADVLTNSNTHSGFKNDGDYTLVVRMPPTTLQSLVDSDKNEWTDCPIAPEIASSAWSLPQHSGELYYAKKTSSSDSDWHRGHLVIVNRATGMAWVYEWKI